jgi:deoxyribonuclease V
MIACVDVDYRENEAWASCVVFRDWPGPQCAARYVERLTVVAPYEPGQFYRRELPCLLAVLRQVREAVDVVIVDGYVWLGGEDHPGLGAYLYEALGHRTPVVGVAKTHFHSAHLARQALRGNSQRPLYVTAVGMDVEKAVQHVQSMSGAFRIPDMLRQADRLCRSAG